MLYFISTSMPYIETEIAKIKLLAATEVKIMAYVMTV